MSTIKWGRTTDSLPTYYGSGASFCRPFVIRRVGRRWYLSQGSQWGATPRKWEPVGEPYKRLADAKLAAESIAAR